MSSTPTGIQHCIDRETPAGRLEATVTEVGASLRALTIDGVDLLQPYPEEIPTPSCAGVVLVPWPNRVRDGVWRDGEEERQLAITEPKLRNASHGLLRYSPYSLVEPESAADADAAAITLAATVFPQLGYPYQLETSVRYALVDDGVVVTHAIENVGEGDAPFAVGAHPYPTIGGVDAFELTVRVDAATHVDVDEQRIPVGSSPVEGTPFDLRAGVRAGDVSLDDAYLDVSPDANGEHVHSLTAPDGRSVEVWGDESFGVVQVFTTSVFKGVGGLVNAVAVEPMTAPADALNSGTGLRRLAPGETWTGSWGIRFRGF